MLEHMSWASRSQSDKCRLRCLDLKSPPLSAPRPRRSAALLHITQVISKDNCDLTWGGFKSQAVNLSHHFAGPRSFALVRCTLLSSHKMSSFIACIGTGFSGIGVGAQLKRWYQESDIVFFERHESLGGTWWINAYPGCACDVPAPLYSYSFEQSPNWTSLFPPAKEIKGYLENVASKYDIPPKVRFSSNVRSCTWDRGKQEWVLVVEKLQTGDRYHHTCKILFSCSGQLVAPAEIDVPGKEEFRGAIFHSARWRPEVEMGGKRVVVIGNGCTAAQIVPSLLKNERPASLTQVIRSQHWVLPAPRLEYTPAMRAALTYVPGLLSLLRFLVFALAELSFPFFYMNPIADWYRQRATRNAERYMRSKVPAHLHEAIIPTFSLGCKRRVFDPGYLDCLSDERMHLETRKTMKIVADGLVLADGTTLDADVIVTANGFRTNHFLDQLDVTGINGQTIGDHWSKFGGPEAYNCSLLSGFPNFFIILGPNAATGHTSAIMACEK